MTSVDRRYTPLPACAHGKIGRCKLCEERRQHPLAELLEEQLAQGARLEELLEKRLAQGARLEELLEKRLAKVERLLDDKGSREKRLAKLERLLDDGGAS